MNSVRRLGTIWISAAVLALAGCGAGEKEGAQSAGPPPGVLVASVELKTLRRWSEFVGRTLAVNDVSVRARVEGYLLEVPFKEGADVGKGDLLFVIDPAIYQAKVKAAEGAVAEAKAALTRAKRDFARYQDLAKKNVASKQQLDKARADMLEAEARLKSAEAALMEARVNLEYTRIRAPIDGRVGHIAVSVGNLVGPQSGELTRLVELDPIYASFAVSERDFLNFQKLRQEGAESVEGIEVRLRLPNGDVYPESGHIDFIDNRVNPRTGAVLVRARFENPGHVLVPGINVTVVLVGQKPEAVLLVPQAALMEDQAGQFVLVVDRDDTVARRGVALGRVEGAYRVVRDGLNPGERVIVEGVQKVRPGMKVTTKPWQAPDVLESREAR